MGQLTNRALYFSTIIYPSVSITRHDELLRREESSQPWRAKVVFGSLVDGTIFAPTEAILVVH